MEWMPTAGVVDIGLLLAVLAALCDVGLQQRVEGAHTILLWRVHQTVLPRSCTVDYLHALQAVFGGGASRKRRRAT